MSTTDDAVVGSITIRKVLGDSGFYVRADYSGIDIYDAIGILTAELDTQRRVLAQSREDDA